MSLAQPAWLLLLILIPLLGVGAVLVQRLRRRQWDAFAAARLRNRLILRGSHLPRWLSLFFILAASSALIIALTRPQGDQGVRSETVLGRNVLIALDLSRSMRVTDVNPDRLSQAKIIIYELLEALPSDRIGLIGFSGRAHLFAPLTVDHAAVRETVEQIDENWTTIGGSNLAAAISLSIETLKETGQNNNALVVISDGEENEGQIDTMIAEAERAGVYVIAIGVGTEDGGFVPHPNFPNNRLLDRAGQPVLSRLQTELLRKLANDTGGRYAVAGSGADLSSIVTSAVREMDSFEVTGRERHIVVEYYQWLVLPGILFLIVSIIAGTRWRGVRHPAFSSVLLLSVFAMAIPDARADKVSDAKSALENGEFKKAQESYHRLAGEASSASRASRYRVGEGTAAYRSGDFRSARSAFSEAILAEDPAVSAAGHYGMGNTLFQLGWQGLAGEAYPDASQPPDLEAFEALVLELLASMQAADLRDSGDSEDFIRLDSLMVNWADAVRHYDSALAANPSDKSPSHNREVAVTYLRRLKEILEEEHDKAEQAMPQPMPGQGPPQEGEGGEGEDGEGEGGDQDGEGEGGEDDSGEGRGGSREDDEEGEGKNNGPGDPNESPEDRARRILGENADLERGPLGSGRHEFRNPEKDW